MMGASDTKENVMETLAEARWLAGKEIKRAWLSYPVSGLFVLFLGLLVVPALSGVLELEGLDAPGRRLESSYNAFFPDLLFLIMGAVLTVNSISGDYLRIWQDDVFSRRLLFLRSLPISTRSLVASRVMSMLFALPFTGPAFFLPVFLLSDLGELGVSYLWFVGIWLGWSLLYAGFTLFCEFGMSGKVYTWISLANIGAFLVVVAALEWTADLRLVERTASLAQSYGALPAVASLAIGVCGLVLLARVTVRRVGRRDLSA